jgi:ribose-phosphate pyrophosphokinase
MRKIINLENPNQTGISYTISKFPDGQQSLTINEPDSLIWYKEKEDEYGTNKCYPVRIYKRLRDFKDVEILLCATAALKEIGVSDISLYIPYFIGARSDRKFSDGGFNYVKDVISPIINAQGYSEVIVLDPHSDAIESCIKNFKKDTNVEFSKICIDRITMQLNHSIDRKEIAIISPDAGALKKIYAVAEHNEITDVIVASKHRDITTGKIVSTNVPLDMTHANKTFVIFDDICDGGRTFIDISKAIKEKFPDNKIFLCVTHGIFSNSFLDLSMYFENVYSTNSYSDIECSEHSDYTVDPKFLSQFEVI